MDGNLAMSFRHIAASDHASEARDALALSQLKFDELKAFASTVHKDTIRAKPHSMWPDPYKTWTQLPVDERQEAVNTLRELCQRYNVFEDIPAGADTEGAMRNRLSETRRIWCRTQRDRMKKELSSKPQSPPSRDEDRPFYDPIRDI